MKIVRVTWIDSTGDVEVWRDRGELIQPETIESVGYLLKKTKRTIWLAQSFHANRIGGQFAIPRGCIKKMRRC